MIFLSHPCFSLSLSLFPVSLKIKKNVLIIIKKRTHRVNEADVYGNYSVGPYSAWTSLLLPPTSLPGHI